MNEIFTKRVSGNEVFDTSLESLPPSAKEDILKPITADGVMYLAIIHGWSVQPESVDPRS